MTMPFAVKAKAKAKAKALPDRLKRSGQVMFRAVQDAGRFTVVDLQAMP